MTKLIVDIETLPDLSEGAKERVKATLKAPGNYSKPETIAKWIEDNADEAWRKTSFDGGFGSICVLGYAIDDEPARAIIAEDEASALREFFAALPTTGVPEWIGHNVLGFDLPFLWKRTVIHGLGLHNFVPKDARHGNGKVFDTMQAWAGYKERISLDALAKILGLPSHKADFDGSMVYDAWVTGERKKIADYCVADVELTRAIYRRMA